MKKLLLMFALGFGAVNAIPCEESEKKLFQFFEELESEKKLLQFFEKQDVVGLSGKHARYYMPLSLTKYTRLHYTALYFKIRRKDVKNYTESFIEKVQECFLRNKAKYKDLKEDDFEKEVYTDFSNYFSKGKVFWNFFEKNYLKDIAKELLIDFCYQNDLVVQSKVESFLSDIEVDEDAGLSLVYNLDKFLSSFQVTEGLTAVGILEKFVKEYDVSESLSQGMQWLECPQEGEPHFVKKMCSFIKQFEDPKGKIPVDMVIQCCDRIQDKAALRKLFVGRPEEKVLEVIYQLTFKNPPEGFKNKIIKMIMESKDIPVEVLMQVWDLTENKAALRKLFVGRPEEKVLEVISRVNFKIGDFNLPRGISPDILNSFKKKITEMLLGMKDEDRVTRENEFVDQMKKAIANQNVINDETFTRVLIPYAKSLIDENEEFFHESFLIENMDFPSLMSGKDASGCLVVLEELLEKYLDCQDQIKEKFLKTNLDQDLKEKILDAKGWVAPKMCEKKQEDVCEEKGVAVANGRKAFSGQGIMIGGSDLDDKQSADSKEDIENLKKENKDLCSENTALKQLLKEKDAIIEKFYRFQQEQQDAFLRFKNSGEEFIRKMKETEEKAEANAGSLRKNKMRED